MKIFRIIVCGVLLFLSAWSSRVMALEKPAGVKAEGVETPGAVLSWDGEGRFIVEFLIRSLPTFNQYDAFLGEENVAADLSPLQVSRATWMVVIDTSDPEGRAGTILGQKGAMFRFLTLISPESKVGIYSLSRDLVPLWEDRMGDSLKSTQGVPIWFSQQKKRVLNPKVQPIIEGIFENDGDRDARMNTNLWVGLTRALRERLPKLADGHYANLPKGILLLSDGVDESSTSSEDLNLLIKEARELGVPVHTLAFPHKDGGDAVAKHRGFNVLQRLSSETGGIALSYDAVNVDSEDGVAKLLAVVRSTEAKPMYLTLPVAKIKSGNDITLKLHQGTSTFVGSLNVSQYDVAHVVGDYWLNALYKGCSLYSSGSTEHEYSPLKIGALFVQKIYSLPIRDELFNYTEVDEPFVRRVRQIVAHLDAHPELIRPELMTLTNNIKTEDLELLKMLGNALTNFGAPLPEPRKEQPITQQPVIINNNSSPSSGGSDELYAEDSVQDWVWWSLGVGGSALAVLLFWLVVRIATRSDAPVRIVTGAQGEESYSGPTKPVLASLVNAANPVQSWVVSNTPCRVGRHSGNDIALPFSYVSGVQFILSRSSAGQWELRDAQSTNGTMVNGKKVKTTQLNSGDVIRIAELELEFKIR